MDRNTLENLERLIAQMKGMHTEISSLTKKNPGDAVNKFKLNLTNSLLEQCNSFLGEEKPFQDFEVFNPDDLPTNSDVTVVLSQYSESLEIWRSSNIISQLGTWYYQIENEEGPKTLVRTLAPKKLTKD